MPDQLSVTCCRAAAEELLKQNFGWFAEFFTDAIQSAAFTKEGRVGKRKRAAKWTEREKAQDAERQRAGGNGYSVPLERALVPISVYAREP